MPPLPPLPPVDPAALPLVLAGPIVRRVDSTTATVWLALKAPRKVTLEVLEGAAGDPATTLRLRGTAVTSRLGQHLHVVAVTATAVTAGGTLAAGTTHRYALRFGEDVSSPGTPVAADAPDLFAANVVAATAAEARRRLVYAEAAGAPATPSFVTPPASVATLRIFHTSCRKPHGEGADALTLLDEVLAVDAGSTARRPQQLFLTGDQIYADDVADALLHLCTTRGATLLGRTEALPGTAGLPETPGNRQQLVTEKAGVTTKRGASHLLRFAEFAAMYLMAWSEVLWPERSAGTLLADVHPLIANALGVPEGERPPPIALGHSSWTEVEALVTRFNADGARLDEFRNGLVAVRRALANTATYTVLDDHEVTDDWFATEQSLTELIAGELGRRLLGNALAAHAVFQAWGNTPEQFADTRPGRALLDALAQPDPAAAGPAAAIARRTGVPTGVSAGFADREDGSLAWHYRIEWPAHQAVVLDTRTRRFYPGGPKDPSALLYGDVGMADMVDVAADTGLDKLTLLVSAPPVVGHPFLSGFGRPQLRSLRSDAVDLIADQEGWGHQQLAFESLVARLLTKPAPSGPADGPKVRRRRVVALSGDVGYGFAARLSYEATAALQRPGTGAVRGVIAQLTAGAARGETTGSIYLQENGMVERSRTIPAVERVAWANETGGPIDAGLEPDPARPGQFVQWRPKGFPAVADITPAHTLTRNPDWRYRVDFYRHEDPDRLAPRNGAPAAVTFPPEDVAQRRKALGWYVRAAANHSGYRDRWGDGKQLVGRNNLAELRFTWRDGDAKSVVQTLWWRLAGEATGAPLTMLSVPLDVGQAPSLPVENLPALYGNKLLVEGSVDNAADPADEHHVRNLQRDLQELGFLIVLDRTGKFDRMTRWAVRELQTYAQRGKLARVATAFTRLRTALTDAATTMEVESTAGFPAAPFRVRVRFENIEVTEVAGTTWTVVRGKDDTEAFEAEVGDGVTWLPVDTSVPNVATDQWYGYGATLESVDVPEQRRYTGRVHGDVDKETREIISRWKLNNWRCPVVVEVWDRSDVVPRRLQRIAAQAANADHPRRPARIADNVWHWNDTTNPDRRVRAAYARDFSDRWTRPAAHPADTGKRDEHTIIGMRTVYLDPRGADADPLSHYGGPVAYPWEEQCWPESEILPELMTGQALNALGQSTLSTFKVIRAVAEVEALGYVDAANCYDHAFASMGPCHWTFGTRTWHPIAEPGRPPREMWDADEGELWAFFAYLRSIDEAAFNHILGDCGIGVDRVWQGDGHVHVDGPRSPWNPSERKYTALGTRTDRNGNPQLFTGFAAPAGSGLSSYGRFGDQEVFRVWHWYYRFVMAARTVVPFQRAMWDVARMRVRDVLSTQWNGLGAQAAPAQNPYPMVAGTTIGDVFRSEHTTALLHRWHVFSPAVLMRRSGVANPATADVAVQNVVVRARAAHPELVWGNDPSGWDDRHERALAASILAGNADGAAGAHPLNHDNHPGQAEPGHTLRQVDDWPAWYAAAGPPHQPNARHYTLALDTLPADQRTLRYDRDFVIDVTGLP